MPLRKPEKIEVLSRLPLFAGCPRRELAALASVSVDESFPAGAVLTREGHSGGLAYVVLRGSATARRAGRKVGRIEAGAVVGELALIDGGRRTATVTADDAVEVLAVNGDDFQRLLGRSPRFALALLETLAGRIRDADRRGDLRH